MASPTLERTNANKERNISASSINELPNHVCARCGGLLVSHFCMDLQNSVPELDITARRCVQCGDVVDPVILRNRRLKRALPAPLPTEASNSSTEIKLASLTGFQPVSVGSL